MFIFPKSSSPERQSPICRGRCRTDRPRQHPRRRCYEHRQAADQGQERRPGDDRQRQRHK